MIFTSIASAIAIGAKAVASAVVAIAKLSWSAAKVVGTITAIPSSIAQTVAIKAGASATTASIVGQVASVATTVVTTAIVDHATRDLPEPVAVPIKAVTTAGLSLSSYATGVHSGMNLAKAATLGQNIS